MWIYWRLFLIALRLAGRRRRDLVLENLVLRQQLAVWERTGRHPTLAAADRRFWSVTARHWRGGGGGVDMSNWCSPPPWSVGTGRRGGATGVGRAADDLGVVRASIPSSAA